ncbi:hypothetical protein FZI85_08670 [Mycobacterium sp. CBMA293]|uniref:3'-5' exonuclease n=1 Tax=unclassified Mycolicibacterium TaxID=2636767 RepID=UPI0012DEAD5F|nr:hypothetical protein [Mycolicibacterium sp. CBMA 360]MUL57157.1 hypothetical protein [Mycolicibacterium sp. CBMA 335]MUL70197.1 hypothetical protein [Mycolicibacterium sp. CBMA 311]MUL92245.1 hypothetical protein [Mycolicibacterium sp. CBMA 230]MUM04820.1 hypothetical protein [Mycolicibacterium sp. CBMA 213]MUM11101.1 hypothetical protein [Mycolicibacterium sp. CBMA 293]MUM34667.1 hypothetical protein [Mycolicibacterium sp. CBMA 361]
MAHGRTKPQTRFPLLTIHRSKGLEYHAVVVLDLDDDQWWSHRRDTTASTATFFVGLSRAAQRVIFTRATNAAAKALSPISTRSCSRLD